jgi:glutamine amidotransferase
VRVTVFDYGAGNLHSLVKALAAAPHVDVRVAADPSRAVETDVLVLPGVGAFGAAAARLAAGGGEGRERMREAVRGGLPLLGICLGMQLLFDESEEGGGPGAGLGVIPGRVTRLRARRVPQIGWNELEDARDPLLEAAPLRMAYFANGYACRPAHDECVAAWSEHEGDRFPAMVRGGGGRVVGVQFHPEKSSAPGVELLRAFLAEQRR